MPHERNTRHIKMSFVLLTILFVLTLGSFAWLLNDVRNLSHKSAKLSKATAHLSIENTKRINEIQASRTLSCQATYRSYSKVFNQLFPEKSRTETQKTFFMRLHQVQRILIEGCKKQTQPPK